MRNPAVIVVQGETRTEYATREIHEHRAPTDKSVELLKEMEQAARDKIEQSINVGGNGFECVVYVMTEDMSMDTVARAIFKLNGKEMRAEARVFGWDANDARALPVKLRDAVAEKIANEVLASTIEAAMRSSF